jgi:hypothetical protein
MLPRSRLDALRARFLPVYHKAMAASGGDLWGCSPLDLACDNLPEVPFDECQELILDLQLASAEQNEAYRAFRAACEAIEARKE